MKSHAREGWWYEQRVTRIVGGNFNRRSCEYVARFFTLSLPHNECWVSRRVDAASTGVYAGRAAARSPVGSQRDQQTRNQLFMCNGLPRGIVQRFSVFFPHLGQTGGECSIHRPATARLITSEKASAGACSSMLSPARNFRAFTFMATNRAGCLITLVQQAIVENAH